MDLKTPLTSLPGVGPRVAASLRQLELKSVADLIYHFPFRYEDFSQTSTVAEAIEGQLLTMRGQVWSIKNVYTRFGKVLTQAILNDGTNSIELVWFNQSWLLKSIRVGENLQVSGKVTKKGSRLSLVMPKWEKIGETSANSYQLSAVSYQRSANSHQLTAKPEALDTGRLVPIYPETFGLTSKWFRHKIAEVLPQVISLLEDPLPEEIRSSMPTMQEAIQEVHFPSNVERLKQARHRLAFEELFFIQLATLKTRQDWQQKQLVEPLKIDLSKKAEIISRLPYKLTGAQVRVIDQVLSDLARNVPMNRLVQGEVGSGKTVVAAVVAYLVTHNRLQVLLMAPTEILALQHYQTLNQLLEPLGIRVGIYTGSQKYTKDKNAKQPNIVVGTHALVAKNFQPGEVGLVIVDEQQRFGVEQRSILRSHAKVPHFLTMTATPIPRTVALTLYGDLDLSVIDELPPGRQIVKTHFVPASRRNDAYKFIETKVKAGDQVYIITPLIEESETMQSAKAAVVEHQRLQKQVFPKLRLGLLHGRLKPKEKEQVIIDFKNKKYDILVSTSVVEVGMDVANASIMVIEGAERFGLSQLHQLRGRVGRGEKESFCFLFASVEDKSIIRRLKNLETIHNGLTLAELDLKMRGSGEVFGTRQSGRFNLKIASLSDLSFIESGRSQAAKVLQNSPSLDKYPQIRRKLADLIASAIPD